MTSAWAGVCPGPSSCVAGCVECGAYGLSAVRQVSRLHIQVSQDESCAVDTMVTAPLEEAMSQPSPTNCPASFPFALLFSILHLPLRCLNTATHCPKKLKPEQPHPRRHQSRRKRPWTCTEMASRLRVRLVRAVRTQRRTTALMKTLSAVLDAEKGAPGQVRSRMHTTRPPDRDVLRAWPALEGRGGHKKASAFWLLIQKFISSPRAKFFWVQVDWGGSACSPRDVQIPAPKQRFERPPFATSTTCVLQIRNTTSADCHVRRKAERGMLAPLLFSRKPAESCEAATTAPACSALPLTFTLLPFTLLHMHTRTCMCGALCDLRTAVRTSCGTLVAWCMHLPWFR